MKLSGRELLLAGLRDDAWQWDWTTLGSVHEAKRVKARIVAKADGVWAGSALIPALEAVAVDMGHKLRVRAKVKDGARVKKGQVVMEWAGSARAVLALERPFLNLVAYASGVASATRQLVDVVARVSSARVTSTRKILPYYRDLAIYGVLCGGGVAHRVSLSGGVLLKENHIAAAGGIARAIKGVQAISPHGLKIEIEVRNLDELKQALKAGAEVVMLDNFEPEKVRAAVKQVRESKRAVVIEVSGGLTAANIAEYALPGVDVLSCGGLTHSVRALDLSLLVFGL